MDKFVGIEDNYCVGAPLKGSMQEYIAHGRLKISGTIEFPDFPTASPLGELPEKRICAVR
nr:hypothetical protein [Caballeronia glebae]